MEVLIASGCALAAGLAFAIEGVVQQGVASRGPVGEKPWAMMRRVAGNKKWWAGGFAALCSFGLQALAMAFGPLALVQPLVGSEVLFALPISARKRGVRLGAREWSCALMVVAGLALALASAMPRQGHPLAAGYRWGFALGAGAVIVIAVVLLARRLSGTVRASLFAMAGATVLALQSALYKTSIELLARERFGVFGHWQAYALIVASFLGLYLVQRAYKAGPLAASMPVMDAVLPVGSIALGLGLFGETIRTEPLALTGALIGLAVLITGIVLLDTSDATRRQQKIEDKQQHTRARQDNQDVESPPPARSQHD